MIRPISTVNTRFRNINFCSSNTKPKMTPEMQKYKKIKNCENERLIEGLLVGTMIGAAAVGYVADSQTKNILQDMKTELDASHDKDIIIKDLNGDEFPEIIFEDMNGTTTIYDFVNHNIGIRNNDPIEPYYD